MKGTTNSTKNKNNTTFHLSISGPHWDKKKETAGQLWLGVREKRTQDVRLVLK